MMSFRDSRGAFGIESSCSSWRFLEAIGGDARAERNKFGQSVENTEISQMTNGQGFDPVPVSRAMSAEGHHG
jgi:hypothetical protein